MTFDIQISGQGLAFESSIEKIQRRIEKYKGKRFHARGDGVVIEASRLCSMMRA